MRFKKFIILKNEDSNEVKIRIGYRSKNTYWLSYIS